MTIFKAVPMLVIFAVLAVNTYRVLPADVDVVFLDIGQGDSILIESRSGTTVLIDGGPDRSVLEELGRELPWFDRTIEAMVPTHPDADHITGLVEVARRYDVREIIWTRDEHTLPAYDELKRVVHEKGIHEIVIDHPQDVQVRELQLKILAPPSPAYLATPDTNNGSIVIQMNVDGSSFLFTGDMEAEVEKVVAEMYDVKSDVLKVGHHGSKTSSMQEFLQEVDPDIAVIQVGADNRYGHPHPSVLSRLTRLGIPVLRNDQDGTVRCSISKNEMACEKAGVLKH
ncbi:MAG: MBL fold metallo-hydrolase [Candidatus Kerfeldbacteria bacterium]|nr:MBL fold metallo-hydrolase [Candidatus Kerfeldbacteria bacterium]